MDNGLYFKISQYLNAGSFSNSKIFKVGFVKKK